jgi:type IV fimbrial biogenesis protein FimT
MDARHAHAGATLAELLVAVAIAALVLGLGVPAMRNLVLDARMTAAVNALVHAVHFARQEAQRDLRDVVVCRSTDGHDCASPGDWSSGWIVFVNRDGDDPPAVDVAEPVLHATGAVGPARVRSNRRAYVLRPYALRATNGTVVFCDERGAAQARAVIVSYTGRPRVSHRQAGGQPLACTG